MITGCDLAYMTFRGGSLFLMAWFLFWLNARKVKAVPLILVMVALGAAWIIGMDKMNPCKPEPREPPLASISEGGESMFHLYENSNPNPKKPPKPRKIPLKPPPPPRPEPPRPQPGA